VSTKLFKRVFTTTMSHPDTETFPHATGLALETVNAHSEDQNQDLRAFFSWFCPFVQRVWIALEEKNIPYQYHEINPYKKEEHFMRVNPLGLVPAVEIKGKATLWESLVLLEYLEDAYPNASPLLPKDAIGRAKVRLWVDHVSKKVIPAFYTFLQAQDAAGQDEGKKKLLDGLEKFVKAMSPSSSGPYFFGGQFTIADIVLIPWVLRFSSVMKRYRNFELPTSGGEGDVWTRFKQWEDAVLNRESVKRTSSQEDKYFDVYKRYAENTTQSEVAKATRAGQPLP